MRWVCGLVLLFIGLFAAAAVFFSYFCWREDQSGLPMSAADRAALSIEPKNFCGWAGARLGMWLVDRSFGLFGILIPVMIVLLGVRIIRQRPLLLNHSLLSLVFVMILGSFTLGFAFSDKLTIGSSTGMGGAFGVHTAELLHLHIGAVGTIILLLVGWILTGVFINRNFINTVNAAGMPSSTGAKNSSTEWCTAMRRWNMTMKMIMSRNRPRLPMLQDILLIFPLLRSDRNPCGLLLLALRTSWLVELQPRPVYSVLLRTQRLLNPKTRRPLIRSRCRLIGSNRRSCDVLPRPLLVSRSTVRSSMKCPFRANLP